MQPPDGVSNYDHPLFDMYDAKDIVGIDLFVADENLLHKGYGKEILNEFINHYIKGVFSAVVVDPIKNNQTAIKFFKRMGFVSGVGTSTESQML